MVLSWFFLFFGSLALSLPIRDVLFHVDDYLVKYAEVVPEYQCLVREGPSSFINQGIDFLVQFNRLSVDPVLSKCYALASVWVDYHAKGPREGRMISGQGYLVRAVTDDVLGMASPRRALGISSLDTVSLTPLASGLSRDLVQLKNRFSAFQGTLVNAVEAYGKVVSKFATDLHGCTNALNCFSKSTWLSHGDHFDVSSTRQEAGKDEPLFAASVGLNSKDLRSQLSILTATASAVHAFAVLQRSYLALGMAVDVIVDRFEMGATNACKELMRDATGSNTAPDDPPTIPTATLLQVLDDLLELSVDALVDVTFMIEPTCQVFHLLFNHLPKNERGQFVKEETEMLKRLARGPIPSVHGRRNIEQSPITALSVCSEVLDNATLDSPDDTEAMDIRDSVEIGADATGKRIVPDVSMLPMRSHVREALRNRTQCVDDKEMDGCFEHTLLRPLVSELAELAQSLYRYIEDNRQVCI